MPGTTTNTPAASRPLEIDPKTPRLVSGSCFLVRNGVGASLSIIIIYPCLTKHHHPNTALLDIECAFLQHGPARHLAATNTIRSSRRHTHRNLAPDNPLACIPSPILHKAPADFRMVHVADALPQPAQPTSAVRLAHVAYKGPDPTACATETSGSRNTRNTSTHAGTGRGSCFHLFHRLFCLLWHTHNSSCNLSAFLLFCESGQHQSARRIWDCMV